MAKKQLSIRVEENKHERWKDHAEEDPDISAGVTGLIRSAVKKYISDDASRDRDVTTSVPDDLRERLIEIDERTEDMERVLSRVDESVGFIERDLVGSDDESFSDRLMRAVPPKRPETPRWEGARQEFSNAPIAWEGTIESFVETLDGEEPVIRNALESAARMQDGHIKTAEIGGETRFFAPREYLQQPYADRRQSKKHAEQRRFEERQEGRGR